jgi:hypothetical protein
MPDLSLNGFNEFKDVRKVSSTEPRLNIGKGGRLSINKKAYSDYFKNYKCAKFFFNADKNMIAIKLCSEPSDNTYNIKKSPNSDTGFINCMGFFKHNKVNVEKKRETEFIGASENDTLIFVRIKEF